MVSHLFFPEDTEMSTSENDTLSAHRPPPSDPNGKAQGKVDGCDYQVAFYPGFASAISVNGTPLYKQSGSFVLPSGTTRPWSSHAVEISCPTHGYTLVVHLDDPQHVVDRIELVLRDPNTGNGGGVTAQQSGTKVTVDNAAATCPPVC
jgi:hypothetical protein